MISSIDEYQFDKLFNLLKDSRCLYFTGVGKNLHIANIIASTFNSLTIRSIAIDPVSSVHGDMGLIDENSVVIMISKSGNTKELEFFCQKIKSRNCGSKIFLIHSNNSASLKKWSDFDFYIPFLEECDPWNRVPTCSLVNYLIVLHTIAMEIVDYKKVTVQDFYRNHPGGDIGEKGNAECFGKNN
jgi:arabinose-5-phosphate isomerase